MRRAGKSSGVFMFLGSASIELLQQSSESLAGRIAYHELYAITCQEWLSEETASRLHELWVRGGFPDSLLAHSDAFSYRWRHNFISTYLERDIPQLGPRIPAATLRDFWTMLAHSQGETINATKFAQNLDVSNVTIGRYMDLFVDLLLVRKLRPYTRNIKKRIVKSPRLYLRDSGITHALLNIENHNDLLGHPVVGKSWEGFLIESIAASLPPTAQLYFYRSTSGHEIDLIIEFSFNDLWAIEIKRSAKAGLSPGFFEACKDINPSRQFMLCDIDEGFPSHNEVQVVNIVELVVLIKDYTNHEK